MAGASPFLTRAQLLYSSTVLTKPMAQEADP